MRDISLEVWGDFACFSRPECKVERLSYPIITPSAARGILSAIYSKPVEFYWQVKRIEVLKPIKYISFKRNEVVNSKISDKMNIIFVDETLRPKRAGAAKKSVSNFLVEKAEIVLNIPNAAREKKHDFYMSAMKDAGERDPLIALAVKALEEQNDIIVGELLSRKIKPSDLISIMIDGMPLENSTGYLEWWEEFRKRFKDKKGAKKKETSELSRCFITGELTEPVRTAPKFSGLISVGGHTSGDTVIGFDKDAFCSYGLTQAANAAVSEEAITAVNAALEKLVKEGKTLAGAKYIHWFGEAVKTDVFNFMGFGSWEEDPPESSEKDDDEVRVRKLFDSFFSGGCPENPKNKYYMLSLSGASGRTMIRSYDEGYYGELYDNLKAWYDDLSLEGRKYPKLWTVYTRLLKFSESEKKFSERISKELSGLSVQIINSIMHNSPLPDTVASRSVDYIRHDMYNSDDDSKKARKNIDTVSCQILKEWLNRKYRINDKEELLIMDKINKDSPSAAYRTGRMLAVYAALQNKALGDVNAGIAEKYFTSACTSPQLVMGKLAALSQYHLAKLKISGLKFIKEYDKRNCRKDRQNIPNNDHQPLPVQHLNLNLKPHPLTQLPRRKINHINLPRILRARLGALGDADIKPFSGVAHHRVAVFAVKNDFFTADFRF